MKYPDPPMCCEHIENVHSRERCQRSGCPCERGDYDIRQQAAAKARHPAGKALNGRPVPIGAEAPPDLQFVPPPPDPREGWRFVITYDGSTADIEMNPAVFDESDPEVFEQAMAEVRNVCAQVAVMGVQSEPVGVVDDG